MIELMWNIISVYCLSSIFLAFQILIFIKNDNIKIAKKMYLYLFCIFSFSHAFFIQFIPQYLMLIFYFLLITSICIIKLKLNIKYCFMIILKLCSIFLVVDTTFIYIYHNIFKIDIVNLNFSVHNIVISLPVKIIETIIIILYVKRGDIMGWVAFWGKDKKEIEKESENNSENE